MKEKIAGLLLVGMAVAVCAYGNEIAGLLGMQITDTELAAAGQSIRGSISMWEIVMVIVGILTGSRVLAMLVAGGSR